MEVPDRCLLVVQARLTSWLVAAEDNYRILFGPMTYEPETHETVTLLQPGEACDAHTSCIASFIGLMTFTKVRIENLNGKPVETKSPTDTLPSPPY